MESLVLGILFIWQNFAALEKVKGHIFWISNENFPFRTETDFVLQKLCNTATLIKLTEPLVSDGTRLIYPKVFNL